jgi:catechol 2,3-dioxygenase
MTLGNTNSQAGIGDVSLLVDNIVAEMNFYQELGLRLRRKKTGNGTNVAELGTQNSTLLKLIESKGSNFPERSMAGLYHFAIRLPDRADLGETYLSVGMHGIPFEGFADHGVSEALYLSDPEGNGIEIYSDKPFEMWEKDDNNRIKMVTKPLNIDSLIREAASKRKGEADNLMPEGTKIGHIHLKVTDLQRSVDFYTSTIGFDVTQRMHSAAFLSFHGYHHHIGLNTWESLGGRRWQDGYLGLAGFTVVLDETVGNSSTLAGKTLEDPDRIKITVRRVANVRVDQIDDVRRTYS